MTNKLQKSDDGFILPSTQPKLARNILSGHEPIVVEIPKVTIGTEPILKALGCSSFQEPMFKSFDNFTSSYF